MHLLRTLRHDSAYNISQGSVATRWRCGEIFNDHYCTSAGEFSSERISKIGRYLQAGGRHIQDTIYWHSGLPISPHPRLSTSTHIMMVRHIVTFSTSDAASVVGESVHRQRSFSLELTVI